jgi:hypothetical protein
MHLKIGVPRISQKSVEWQADRIKDPVARLRYLRRETASDPEIIQFVTGQSLTDRSLRRFRTKWRAAAFLVVLASLLITGYKVTNPNDRIVSFPLRASAASIDVLPDVWQVDKTQDHETYSNGLRIDNRYAVSNQTRTFYPVYQRAAMEPSQPEWRSQIAGIVYHTTESDQARFEEGETPHLKRIGKDVLTFLQRMHCYHFMIDRFGQVFRVVQESDVANHAGHSVWADDQVVFVNLNNSFLGIAFETQTQQGQDLPAANPAQIHAARVLTQMLRAKYHIPAANCVTHAQVSVNPVNMLVGYHTDWSGNFPFLQVGLNDNYTAPPPSIYAFGFDYDPSFVHATGARIWEGLALAEDQMRAQAASQGLPVPKYRSMLQQKYKEIIAALKAIAAAKETSHATQR